MISLFNFLIFSILIYPPDISNGQTISETKVCDETCIEEMLAKFSAKLHEPIISDEYTEKDEPYETNLWEEPPFDFYHPYSFDLYAGLKTELFISSVHEDEYQIYQNPQALDMTLILSGEIKILVTSTITNLIIRKTTPSINVHVLPISYVANMDYGIFTNPSTGEDEIYILALQNLGFEQKIIIFKLNPVSLSMTEEYSMKTPPDVFKIKLVNVPLARKNLVFVVRRNDVWKNNTCTSDVFQVGFEGHKMKLSYLQNLRTSGAVDVETFTINGKTYLAVANSFCLYSDLFIFDEAVNGFYLFQRLPLPNATDFQYFNIGFRHFIASVSVDDAIIFEWEVYHFVEVQRFPTSRSDLRQWHSLRLPWKNQAVLLLVNDGYKIQIVRWSKKENGFVVETKPICVTWLFYPNLVGSEAATYENPYYDFHSAKLDCTKKEENCIGLSEVQVKQKVVFVPEKTHQYVNYVPEKTGSHFHFKVLQHDMSCFTLNDPISIPRILSYYDQDLIYVHLPFHDRTRTFVFTIRSVDVQDATSRSSVQRRLTAAKENLAALETKLENHRTRLRPQNAVNELSEQYITEITKFDTKLTVTNRFKVDKFEFEQINDDDVTLDIWEERFQLLNRKIDAFNDELKRAISITEPVIHLPDNIHFANIEVKGEVISKRRAEVTNINGVPIIPYIETAARWDQPDLIYGSKIFNSAVTHYGIIEVSSPIGNRRFPEDILTTTTEQILEGQWYFDDNVEIDSVSTQLLNGINLTLTLTSIDREDKFIYYAPKEFRDRLVIEGDLIVKEINGINLESVMQNAVRRFGEQKITGQKVFTKEVTVKGNLNANTINGFNIPHLDSTTVKNDQPAIITATKIFAENVYMNGNVHLKGLINNLNFSNFVRKHHKSIIFKHKEFLVPVIIRGNLYLAGAINGVPVEDAVTLDTQQEIFGKKFFTGGVKTNELQLTGRIDGMTIKELKWIANFGRNFSTNRNHFYSMNVTGNLVNVKTINDMQIKDLLEDAVFKNDELVELSEEIIFEQSVKITGKVTNLEVINHLNLRDDFLNTQRQQVVTGKKTFKKRVTFHDVEVDGFIDNVNITDFFETVVTLDKPQNVKGDIKFVDGFEIRKNLEVYNTFDTVDIPRDILFRNQSKVITARKTFNKGIRTKTLKTNKMKILGFLNSIEWRKFESERVTLSTSQDIFGRITFLDGVRIKENLRVTGRINNVDSRKLTQHAMMKSQPQTISGVKTIKGKVTADTIMTGNIKKLSTVNLVELKTQVIRIHDNTIQDTLYFDEVQVKGHTTLIGKFNGVDITEMLEDAVLKSSDKTQDITGPKIFLDAITVKGSIDVKTLNGLDPARDIFFKTLPQKISGGFTLTNVFVEDNVIIHGLVNRLNIKEFNNNVLKTNEDASLSLLVFENEVFVNQHLNITETINNIRLSDLLNNAVSKSRYEKLDSRKEFLHTLTVHGNVEVRDTVNGIKLRKFVKDVVLLTETQEIFGIITFLSEVEITKSVKITGNLTVKNTINGINFYDLASTTILTDVPHVITGKKTFVHPVTIENNVMFDETVNEITFPDDVILNKGDDQMVYGVKTFEHLIVTGEIRVINVNNTSLEDLYYDTFFNDNHKPITGRKTFTRHVTFEKNVNVVGNVCGIKMEDIMITDVSQTVTGVKTIHDMTVTGSAQLDNLNGRPFRVSPTLWNNIQNPTDAHYMFLGKTTFHDLVEEPVPVPVPDISPFISELGIYVTILQNSTEELSDTCGLLTAMAKPLEKATVTLSHFELLYKTDLINGGQPYVIKYRRDVYFLVKRFSDACAVRSLYLWRNGTFFEKVQDSIEMGDFSELTELYNDNDLYVVTSYPFESRCGIFNRVYKLNPDTKQLEIKCTFDIHFHRFSVLYGSDVIYIATTTHVFTIDFTPRGCNIVKRATFSQDTQLIATSVLHDVLITGTSDELNFYSPKENFRPDYPSISIPGLSHLVAISTHGKQYIIVGRDLMVANLNVIEVYQLEYEPRKGDFSLILLKQSKPTNNHILDIKGFSFGPLNDGYVAVLYKKFGINVMKVEGYETYNGIHLPVTSAKFMLPFVWEDKPYLLLSPVGVKEEIHIFSGIIKGESVKEIWPCNHP